MEIRPELSLAQSQSRGRKTASKADVGASDSAPASPYQRSDSGRIRVDQQQAAGFIAKLRDMDVSDVHRLDQLQQAIDEGSYSSDPASFADSVLEALDQEGR